MNVDLGQLQTMARQSAQTAVSFARLLGLRTEFTLTGLLGIVCVLAPQINTA